MTVFATAYLTVSLLILRPPRADYARWGVVATAIIAQGSLTLFALFANSRSPTAIYLHFKDKQELVFSLCEESFAKLVDELETLADEYPDPLVRLRKGMERYVAFGLKNPNHYIPAFVLPPPADLDVKRQQEMLSPRSNGMRALATLRDTIADGVKAKKLRKVDADVAARAAWAALHGITSLLIVHDRFPWGNREQVVQTVIDALIDGLKRR
ncbi:MAG: hypothetical protein AUI11_08630 [Acidobacteria bacterium 13_2_20CM_2_66_4]|nr:MAG: hypothetical protein AUI11_08630 [Acidobacteria bacterium 13_2_20CM_2_66_4]